MFDAEAWNDRSNYIAMLLLTTVTFKQVAKLNRESSCMKVVFSIQQLDVVSKLLD